MIIQTIPSLMQSSNKPSNQKHRPVFGSYIYVGVDANTKIQSLANKIEGPQGDLINKFMTKLHEGLISHIMYRPNHFKNKDTKIIGEITPKVLVGDELNKQNFQDITADAIQNSAKKIYFALRPKANNCEDYYVSATQAEGKIELRDAGNNVISTEKLVKNIQELWS